MAFLKTQYITIKRRGTCNAWHCLKGCKKIAAGERVMWTVHTYRNKTISAIWHPECFKLATQPAPYWDQLMRVQQNRAALPKEYYDPSTGLTLSLSDPRHPDNNGGTK